MKLSWVLLVVACLLLVWATAPVQAGGVAVRAPFTSVQVGPGGTHVVAPFTRVHVPGRPAVVVRQPAPVEVLHAPMPVQPVAVQALTHVEFARAFRPLPGTYDVVLLHPDTCCPVRVCFTLPPGCPRKVRVERRELEFDYGDYEVEIRFKRNGRVKVEYND